MTLFTHTADEKRKRLRSLGWSGIAGYWRPPYSHEIWTEEQAFAWLEEQTKHEEHS